MASPTDWKQLLIPRYPSYKTEVEAFLDGLDVSNSNDILVQIIFESIEFNDSIPDNLKLLYAEAANGTDKEVKARMKSRVIGDQNELTVSKTGLFFQESSQSESNRYDACIRLNKFFYSQYSNDCEQE